MTDPPERKAAPARVVCAGGAAVDRKYRLTAPAVPGTSNPARARTSDGGVARNVAENLARLGVPVALVSRVGDDPAGSALLTRLRASGVDVSGVGVVPGRPTADYVAVLDPGGGLVLGVSATDVVEELAPADLDRAWPPRGGVLFADCNLPAAALAHALRRARSDGVRLAVDAVSTAKVRRLPADLTGVDVLFCNRDEALALLGSPAAGVEQAVGAGGAVNSDEALAVRIREAGAARVVLTVGAAGVVVADAAGVRRVPAVPATVVDVTGAGDALVAGVLGGLVAGRDLDGAVRSGAALAARTVASPGSVVPGPEEEPA